MEKKQIADPDGWRGTVEVWPDLEGQATAWCLARGTSDGARLAVLLTALRDAERERAVEKLVQWWDREAIAFRISLAAALAKDAPQKPHVYSGTRLCVAEEVRQEAELVKPWLDSLTAAQRAEFFRILVGKKRK